MIKNKEKLTSCLNLANEISNLSRQSVQDLLEISKPTLTLYQGYINSIEGINNLGWTYIKNQRGFNRKSIFILCVFKNLVNTLGVPQAILQLKSTLEDSINDI